jgi:hypothetical protein
VRILLGSSYFGLRDWRNAITVLEAVDALYEPDYQRRMKAYEKQKKLAEENEKQAPKLPVRYSLQIQAREWLGRAYIEAKTKIKEAKAIFAEQVKSYSKRESPKYWEGMRLLCEATRLEPDLEEVVKYLFVVSEAIDSDPVKTGRGSPKDFLDLALQVQREVAALTDAALKAKLLATLDGVIKKLKEAASKGDQR